MNFDPKHLRHWIPFSVHIAFASRNMMMKIYMHKDVVKRVKNRGARGGRLVTNRQHFVWLNFKLFAHSRLFIGSQSINFSYECCDVPANIKLGSSFHCWILMFAWVLRNERQQPSRNEWTNLIQWTKRQQKWLWIWNIFVEKNRKH